MKFNPKYAVLLLMMFSFLCCITINAQNDENDKVDDTKQEQPDNNDENAPQQDEENTSEDEGNASDEEGDIEDAEPQNDYQKWLKKLSSDDDVSEFVEKLSVNLPDTLNTIIEGISSTDENIRSHCVDILIQASNYQNDAITTFILALGTEDSADVMKKMINALVSWRSDAAIPEFVKLLDYEIPAVRVEAVNALFTMQGKESLSTLTTTLEKENYPDVKATIYAKFYSDGNEEEIGNLLLNLEKLDFSQEKDVVLVEIVQCASKYKKQIATDILLRIAKEAPSSKIRLSATEKILTTISREDVGLTVDLLWDNDLAIRQKVFAKLSAVTEKSFGYNPEASLISRMESIGQWQSWKQLDELVYWLNSEDEKEALDAYSKLLDYGISSVATLTENYESANDSGKKHIINLLGNYPTPEVLRIIEKGLSHENSDVKSASVDNFFNAWRKFGDAEVLSPIEKIFDENPQENISLACRLADTGYPKAKTFVDKELTDSSKSVAILEFLNENSYGLLGQSIVLENEDSKKIVLFLLEKNNAKSWAVLVANFKFLGVDEKVSLLNALHEAPEELKNLNERFSEEKETKVIVAFSKLIQATKANEYSDLLIKKYNTVSDTDAKLQILNTLSVLDNKNSAVFFETTCKKEQDVKAQLLSLDLYLATLSDDRKQEYIAERIKKEENVTVKTKLYSVKKYKNEDYDELKGNFSEEKNINSKMILLKNLVVLDSEKSQKFLIEIIEKEENSQLKIVALSVLNDKSKATEELLLKIYKTEKDAETKKKILVSIAKISPKKAAALAQESLKKESNVSVFAILLNADPLLAKKELANVLENASSSEEKLKILDMSNDILDREHVEVLLPFIITDESAELYEKTNKALEGIMGKNMTAEELSAWNQNHKNVVTSIDAALAAKNKDELKVAKEKLEEYKESAISELIFQFSQENNTSIVDILSNWRTEETKDFFASLTTNADSKLRKKAYVFLAKEKSFANEASVLYLMELDQDAKSVLLPTLIKAYPERYQSEITQYAKSTSSAEEIFAVAKDIVNPGLVEDLLDVNNVDLQERILNLVGNDSEYLSVIAEKIIDGNEDGSKVFLLSLKDNDQVSSEAKKSREKFVTWWLENEEDIKNQQKVYTLFTKVSSKDILIRQTAEEELKEMELSDLSSYTTKNLSSEQEEGLLILLAKAPNKNQIGFFNKFIESSNESLKLVATQALTKIGYNETKDKITELLSSDNVKIRFLAVQSVGKSKDETAANILREKLDDIDFRVREEAYYWLIESGNCSKETSLEMFGENQPPNIQDLAMNHLKTFGERSIIPKLIAQLDNPFEEIRSSAYDSLVSLSKQDIAFDAKSDDRSDSIEEWNAWWIKDQKEKELKELIANLGNKEANVDEVRKRLVARGTNITKMLKEELKSSNGRMRQQAIITLEEMNNRNATTDIAKLLSDSDIQVRGAAKKALETLTKSKIDLDVDLEKEAEWQKSISDIQKWWNTQEEELRKKADESLVDTKKKVKGLVDTFADEKIDHANVTKQILNLGNTAIPFVEKELANENSNIVIGAVEVLTAFDAKQSVSQIILLLENSEVRESAEKALNTLIGNLPIDSVATIQKKERAITLTAWWQAEQKKSEDSFSDNIDAIISILEQDSDVESAAKKMVALGNDSLLGEYLADNRSIVKQSIITAFIETNDKNNIYVLHAYLKGTNDSERKLFITAIRSITGEAFSPQEPTEEKEWDQIYEEVEEWQKKWRLKKQDDLKKVATNLTKSIDENKLSEAIKEFSLLGENVSASVISLLADENEAYCLGTLDLLLASKAKSSVASIIYLVANSNDKIATRAVEVLSGIIGKELPTLPSKIEVWGVQIAILQKFWAEKQSENFDKEKLKSTLRNLANGDLGNEEVQEILQKQVNATNVISPMLVDNEDQVRLGAVKSLGLIGNFEQGNSVASVLSDANTQVRTEAYSLLSKWAGSKPEQELYPQDETKWQTTLESWLVSWEKEEIEAQLENSRNELKKDSKKVEELDKIWNQEQLDMTKKVVAYLRNPTKEIRDHAADVINDGPARQALKDDEVAYNDEAVSQEDIDENYQEYQNWLSSVQSNLGNVTDELDDDLGEIDSDIAEITGNMKNLDDYENLRDAIAEMQSANNPKILEKYKVLLGKYGCDVSKFDVSASKSKRTEELEKIEESLYYQKKQFEKEEDNSEDIRPDIEVALSLKNIDNEKSLETLESLLDALGKDIDYELRAEIATTIKKVTKEHYEITEKEEIETTVISVREWISNKKSELSELKIAEAKKVKDASEKLLAQKSISSVEDIAVAEILVSALSNNTDQEAILTSLKEANGGKDAGDWTAWLQEQRADLKFEEKLNDAIVTVSSLETPVMNEENAGSILFLLEALSHDSEKIRTKSFKGLETYTVKHSQNKVREGFGYDPKAPVEKLEKPISDWKTWYKENISNAIKKEKEKAQKVLLLGTTLLNNRFQTSRGFVAAEKLLSSLRSDSLIIRQAAITALEGYAKTSYSYDFLIVPEKQANSLALWDSWLTYNKKALLRKYEAKYLETNLVSRVKRSRASEMIFILKSSISLPDLSVIAVSWLRRQSGKDLIWGNEEEKAKTLTDVDTWFAYQEPLYRIDTIVYDLKGGVNTSLDLSSVKLLVAYLDSDKEHVRVRAIRELNNVAGKTFKWNAKESQEKRNESKEGIDSWLLEKDEVVSLQDKIALIKGITELNQGQAKALVKALDSSFASVRKLASEALQAHLPKNIDYAYDASKEARQDAIMDIEDWFDELDE